MINGFFGIIILFAFKFQIKSATKKSKYRFSVSPSWEGLGGSPPPQKLVFHPMYPYCFDQKMLIW